MSSAEGALPRQLTRHRSLALSSGSDDSANGLVLTSFLVIAAVFTLCVAIGVHTAPFSAAVVAMSAAIAVSTAMLVVIVMHNRTFPVMLSALLYLIFFFEIPGFIHLLTNRYPFFDFTYPDEQVDRAALVFAMFCGLLFVGFISRWYVAPDKLASNRIIVYNNSTRWILAAGALSILSIASALAVGYNPLITRIDQDLLVQSPARLVGEAIARTGSFVALMIAVLFWRQFHKRLISALLILSTVVPFLYYNNVLALPRYVIGSYLLTFVFAVFDLTRTRKAGIVVAMLMAQMTVFPLLSDVSRGGGLAAYEFSPLRYLSTHGDFDGFQSVINAVAWTEGTGFKYGLQLLSSALFFVPRPMFPSKSIGTGGEAASFVGYPFINISGPMPAEFYVDFGFVGLVILSFALGWYVHRVDQSFTISKRRGGLGALLPAVMAGYSFILIRGSLVGVLGPFVITTVLTFAAEVFVRHTLRSRRPQGRQRRPRQQRRKVQTDGN